MSYLTYNGKMVRAQGKYVLGAQVPGQIYMTDINDEIVFSSVPNITGSKTISADLYLDSSMSGFSWLWMPESGDDFFQAILNELPSLERDTLGIYDYVLRIQVKNSPVYVRIYSLQNYVGQILHLEIIKGTGSIVSVKANGDTLSSLGNGLYTTSGFGSKEFYGGALSIWNVEVAGEHKWIGYPYGNTDAAWVDTIGSNDVSILGSPQTRNLL